MPPKVASRRVPRRADDTDTSVDGHVEGGWMKDGEFYPTEDGVDTAADIQDLRDEMKSMSDKMDAILRVFSNMTTGEKMKDTLQAEVSKVDFQPTVNAPPRGSVTLTLHGIPMSETSKPFKKFDLKGVGPTAIYGSTGDGKFHYYSKNAEGDLTKRKLTMSQIQRSVDLTPMDVAILEGKVVA